MNKKEFIREVLSEKLEMSYKETEEVLNGVLDSITDVAASGSDLKLAGFGNFEVVNKPERKCRNPKTGKEVICPPSKALKFKPAKALKDAVNV